ncbi:MAG: hypothetical protein IKD30_05090 [Peptococcaceae bacterium]|nr:hypothetical protein [Peptococcaceae bacterium]
MITMLDWNGNGSYDAFDSATDYMLSNDMDNDSSGSSVGRSYDAYGSEKPAEHPEDKPVQPLEEMKPWQYLFTIYFMLGIIYAAIFFFVPDSALIALNGLFGNGIAVVIIVLMILPGLVLFRMVMKDIEKEALSSDKNK